MKKSVLALALVLSITWSVGPSIYAREQKTNWRGIITAGVVIGGIAMIPDCARLQNNAVGSSKKGIVIAGCLGSIILAMTAVGIAGKAFSQDTSDSLTTPESYDLALSQMESTQVLSTADREDMAYALYEEQEPEKVAEDYFENLEQQAAFLSELDQMGEAIVTALAESNAS